MLETVMYYGICPECLIDVESEEWGLDVTCWACGFWGEGFEFGLGD